MKKQENFYIHSIDHEVPYASLEWNIGSVGFLLYFCRNTTKEDALQADWLIVGKCRLPLVFFIYLNCKRPVDRQRQQDKY